MPSLIQLRRGTSAQWAFANTILAAGEVGVETDNIPMRLKVGDGATHWLSLPYLDSGAIRILTVSGPLIFDPVTGILSVKVNEITEGGNF